MNARLLLFSALLISFSDFINADSATWNLHPVDNNWNNAANWTPAIVPDEQATFDVSSVTDISVPSASIGSIDFNPGASAFTISSEDFTITGPGVINNSGVTQNFVATCDATSCGTINLTNKATVSDSVSFTTEGFPTGGFATGSAVAFHGNASAGNGTYHNQGGSVGLSAGGVTTFFDSSTAANGTFIIDAGSIEGTSPGYVWFLDTSSAGDALIIANGGSVTGNAGGQIIFGSVGRGNVVMSNATFICDAGTNGGLGGSMWFPGYSATNTNTCRVKLFGDSTMYVIQANGVDIGSLEGDGIVQLGGKQLSVGRNDLDTTFSGQIITFDANKKVTSPFPGSFGLVKTGTGTLTLTGPNTYRGTTAVTDGTLIAGNTSGSATGTSAVNVEAGTLGGKGSIGGAVTIGTGSGTGAVLAPSVGTNQLSTLPLMKSLTFKADSTYTYKLNMNNARADQVIANRVAIESGAQFSFKSIGRRRLPVGTVFTPISNTSANPITGTFTNLPDGTTFTAGQNNFQVSYSGGDGNDLTLTVVP